MYGRSIFLLSLVILLGLAGVGSAEMVAHWDFEGGFGDAAGNNYAVPIGDTVVALDPERSRVAELDGAGDYIEIPNSPSLNITGNEITIAAWVYFDDVTGPPEIVIAKVFTVGQHTSPYFSYGLHILSNGTPRFWLVTDGVAGNAPGSTNLQSGRWYHLAGVYNGSQMILYVDGEVAATTNKSGSITGYDTVLRLGTNGGLTEQMGGMLDEVRIYNHAMEQADVQAVMMTIGGGYPYAMALSPKDGSIHMDTWVNLSWRPGDFAVSHDLYFSDSFDDVNSATAAAFQGNQTDALLIAGFPGFAYPDGLVPGTTYYWRIDEVNDTDPNSPWVGPVWSFSIPPKTAYDPNPDDGAEFVDLDATFTWTGGYGAKVHAIHLGDNYDEVNNATGGTLSGAASYSPASLEAEKVYYWRVDEFDGVETHKGHIWSFTTPGAVGNPLPANGETDVQMTATLSWTPADNAASHELYFGTDADAVKSATTASLEYIGPRALGAESYDPGGLAWHSSYSWRVDEVYPSGTVKGLVWTFKTADFLVVDDFESYNDIDPPDAESSRIFDTWIDGWGDPTNGSIVGWLNWGDWEMIVHSGVQSMPLNYDNSGQASYSEATATIYDLEIGRDWTVEGVTKLSLWFRGKSANTPEPMYLALNGIATVYDENPNAAQIEEWTEWTIDLQTFVDLGLHLANVSAITLGFGDKNNPQAGGSGKVFFDDIRLYR